MTDLERFRNSMTYQPRDKARFHECPWPTQKGDRLRPRGDYFALGSDGDVNLRSNPGSMRALTFLYPWEVQAGMDPIAVRKRLGRDLHLFGGVDNRALTQGKARIDAEIARHKWLIDEWRLCANARP